MGACCGWQVYAIEKCGGQMVSDGSRRRNPGGVLWNILRERVGPQIYKEIMTEGNRKVVCTCDSLRCRGAFPK